MPRIKKDFKKVGTPITRTDAYEKVTGRALYGGDLKFHGMLKCGQKRVNTVHARIKNIDISEAKKVDGVIDIITHKDIPGDKITGVVNKDQPVFSFDKILCPGDVVALVVGKNDGSIQKAKEKIKVEYEELPIISDPIEAIKNNSKLVHPEFKTNLIIDYPLYKGDIAKGFRKSDCVIERTYQTQFVEHAYLEPEVCIAIPDFRKDVYKIYGSFQNPFTARKIVSQVMNLPLTKIHIKQAEIGGSFGGKDDIMDILAARVCVACKKVQKPVKIQLSREDSIRESYKRHPYIMNYKVGYNRDGKLIAMKVKIVADSGAYASMSPYVTWRSVVQATGPYEIENIQTNVMAVYTNNPYTGAMRGFGSPQIIFAQESLIDEIAEDVGLTPVEFRLKNCYNQKSNTATGQRLDSHIVSLPDVIQKAQNESNYKNKFQKYKKICNQYSPEIKKISSNNFIISKNDFLGDKKTKFKGIGIACSLRGCSLGAEGIDATSALVSVQNDGSVYLLTGLAENGQGLRTTFSIILAEIFGIKVDDIYYLEYSTSNIADGGPTVASRSTLVGGEAVKNAAEKIRKRIIKFLRKKWNPPPNSTFRFENYRIINDLTKREISFKDVCYKAYLAGINLNAYGWFKAPDVHWNEKTGQGIAYFTYVYGCQIAEIEVDITSGKIFVEKITAVHDAGRIINKLGALGQVYGGVTMGVGYGTLEEIIVKHCKIENCNLDEYLLPTSLDIGDIEVYFIENPDKYGPWGAKSLGEPTLEITAAAINNAVYNAIGKRYYKLPLDLEQVKLEKPLYIIKNQTKKR